MSKPHESTQWPTVPRLELLDAARGVAMVAMTVFHFSWDLEFFGYAPAGMTSTFSWKLFARTIAASFLIIAGMGFILAHHNEIRWHTFGKRLAMVAGAAALISIATFATTPERFVFFGILHQITAASLIALLFLRLPTILILVTGLSILILPFLFRADLFFEPYFWWVGLAPFDPPSNDYVPVFPWTGFVLIGMAVAKPLMKSGLYTRLCTVNLSQYKAGKALSFLGRHSLIYYLVHQPIMMAALYGFTFIAPPAPVNKTQNFISQCEQSCALENDQTFCQQFCSCVHNELEKQSIFEDVLAGKRSVSSDPIVREIASFCTPNIQE